MFITKEVEVVTIEDICEIVRLIKQAQDKGNYVRFTLSNYGWDMSISVMVGGFNPEAKYDYDAGFGYGEEETDVERMNETKAYLKGLINDETVRD